MHHFHSLPAEDVLKNFDVAVDKGLTNSEIPQRVEKYGLNKLSTQKQKSVLTMFLEQFKSSMVVFYWSRPSSPE